MVETIFLAIHAWSHGILDLRIWHLILLITQIVSMGCNPNCRDYFLLLILQGLVYNRKQTLEDLGTYRLRDNLDCTLSMLVFK